MSHKPENKNSYKHILKYMSIFGGVQGLGILMSVVRNKLVALLLGPNGLGLMALFNSTIKLVSDTTNLGLATSSVREIAFAYEQQNHDTLKNNILVLRTWCFMMAFIGMFLCIILSNLLDKFTFSWGNHTLHFILLSPIVALTTLIGGELAILKGVQQLRSLALISLYGIIFSLLSSIPLFYFWKQSAIIPSLLIVVVCQFCLTIRCSFKVIPYSIKFKKNVFKQGKDMVKLGIAFVIATFMTSGADFFIKSFINTKGSLEELGLYNAGYMMLFTYAGMVFTAMETDYFPRLSASKNNYRTYNLIVNRQVEVCLLLISPLMIAFCVSMPILLPLLYSGKFLAIIPMVQWGILAMFMRALELPVAYITLAKGDSGYFLLQELVYDALFIGFILVFYMYEGIHSLGIGLSIASIIHVSFLYVLAWFKYKFKLSKTCLSLFIGQFSLALLSCFVVQNMQKVCYWGFGLALFLISSAISIAMLQRKTDVWTRLKEKFYLYKKAI